MKHLVSVVLIVSVVLSMHYKENKECVEIEGICPSQPDESQCTIEPIGEANAPPETTVIISAPIMAAPEVEYTEQVNNVGLSDDVQQYLIEVCREYSIAPELVLAIIQVESGFDASVISKTDDYGLMQINKCNHKAYEKLLGITDFLDPKQNILAGVHMLASLRDDYGCDTEEKMLMAYNLGIGKARALWKQGIVSTSYSSKVLLIKCK